MNWSAVGIIIAIVAFVIARIWLRRWIVRQWLEDQFTDRQAASMLLITQLSPMLLLAGIVLLTSSSAMPLFILLIVLVAPLWIATWGALFTYIVNHGVKERMRKDREASLPATDP